MDRNPLRFSTLKLMAKSPQHCRWAMEHESVPTPTMRIGSLVHAIQLGKGLPVVYPGPVRRGKEFEAFKALHPPDEPIYIESEIATSRAIAEALVAHPEASDLLTGRREETILWDRAGRPCRGTPDVFNPATRTLADLKTTVDASPQRFPHQALRLAYHSQVVWYADGLKSAGLGEFDRLFIIAIENCPPYAVCVYQLTDRAIDFGRRLYSQWFNSFQVAEQSDAWRGYVGDVLDAPEEAFTLEMDGETVEVD